MYEAMLQRAAALVPETSAGRQLVAVAIVDSIGTGFYIAGSAVFLTRGLGLPADQVGVGIAVANLIGFALTVPLGMLSDRLGPKGMLSVMYAWHALWMAVLPFAPSFLWFVVAFTMVTIADCGAIAVMRAVVSRAEGPEQRTRTLGFTRAWRNVGFTVGAALTAPLLVLDTVGAYAAIMVANGVAFAVAAVIVARLRLVDSAPPASRVAGARWSFPRAVLDVPFVALTFLSAALTTHITMMTVGIPIWVSEHTDVPVWVVPVLVMVNTVLAVALQVRFASGGESLPAGRRALQLSALGQAAFCLVVAWTGSMPVWAACVALLVSVVLLTGGELWEAAGSWGLSYRFTPEHREGEYLSVFSLGATAEAIVGPLIVTGIVLSHGAAGWIGAGVALALLSLCVRPVVARLEDTYAARQAVDAPAAPTIDAESTTVP